jgi:AraC-like DNA-binding protein
MEDHSKRLGLSLLAYAAQRDLAPENICQSAGISWEEVNDETKPLSPELIGQLYQDCIRLSNDPLFGLHFGESLQLSALGIVGDAIRTSATVGDALNTALSLLGTVTTAFQTKVTRSKDNFGVSFIPTEPDWRDSVAARQTLDVLMVFLIHELDGFLLKKIIPERVQYWRPIDDWAEYERVLRCRPTITPDVNVVTFANCYWDEPIITANYRLQKIMLQEFARTNIALNGKQPLRTRVQDYLMRNSYLGVVSLGGAAANFHMSVRTLQRRLKEEGVSFETLADEVRKTSAIHYLKSGDYPVKEVSLMLGYNDLGNFTRTFKRWTGMTPSDFQNSWRLQEKQF